MSDELRQAAERINEAMNGGGISLAYPKHWHIGALGAFMAECSIIARAYLAELDADCTDAARPSWWRGNEAGVNAICERVNAILDGKDDGSGVAGEPWESTRRRLLAMAALEVEASDG